MHVVDPFIYLCDVLERVGSCPQTEIMKLLPHNWKTHFGEEATKRVLSHLIATISGGHFLSHRHRSTIGFSH
jgi:hypothetical protein